jgi:peptidyl-dipeptidase Dcp
LSLVILDAFTSDNPFATPSSLPFGAPPFDRIRDEHYLPAIEEGMRRQLAEVLSIAAQAAEPTFDNTIAAVERSGELLTRALKTFGVVTGANTNDYLQAVQTELAPKLAAHSDAIYLNTALFARIQILFDNRDAPHLTAEERHLIERYCHDFVRAGARLSEADKSRLRALNQEESTLTTEFQNRLLAATKAAAPVITDPSELDGLPEAERASAAEAARQRGHQNAWLLPLQNTTQQPWQEWLRRRAVRQRLFEAAISRAERSDDNDTRALITRIVKIRAAQAELLGYATAAAHVLEDQMAKTPPAAIKLLTDIATPATAKARAEAARMQSLIDREGGGFKLAPWDWQYYAEQVRKAEYDLDDAQIRPYFELDRVLRDGLFYAATMLYGITFVERSDIPVYHPDVRVFEVREEDGKAMALFYVDYFKRDNKNGGAWMDSFVDQSGLLKASPVVVNVANFTKPAGDQPALLGYDDVTTMFHEFGHALHGLFSRVQYPTVSGTNVPRDFVEFPSQFNEHCCLEPKVIANYAKHHETGEPMPSSLVERIKKARTFNQGFALTEYIAAAFIDMGWHMISTDDGEINDVESFENTILRRFCVDVPEVPPRYRSTYFAHIWDGGYHAGYFAYLWAEVLDHDAHAWFNENGGLTRENGERFRQMILCRGGTMEPGKMYRKFRGRDPIVEPLLVARGLTRS